MNMSDFSSHDGLGLAEFVRTRQVTPLELLDAAIARIERHNPALNAVVHTAFDEARETAKAPQALARRQHSSTERSRR